MEQRKLDVIIAVVFILGSAYVYWLTYSLPPPIQENAPGPDLYPRIVLIAMAIFAVLLLAGRLSRKMEVESKKVTLKKKALFISIGITFLYVILLPFLGFLIDSFIYIFVMIKMRSKGIILPLLSSAGAVTCFYVLFAILLDIRLPPLGF